MLAPGGIDSDALISAIVFRTVFGAVLVNLNPIFVRSVEERLRSRLNGEWRADKPLVCEISHYPDNGVCSEAREAGPSAEIAPTRELAGEPQR